MAVDIEEIKRRARELSKQNSAEAVKSNVKTETYHRIQSALNTQDRDEVVAAAKKEIPGEEAVSLVYSDVQNNSKIQRDKLTLQIFNKLDKGYDATYEEANNYFKQALVSPNKNVAKSNYLKVLQSTGKTHDGVSFGEKGWNTAEAEDINVVMSEVAPYYGDSIYMNQFSDLLEAIVNVKQGSQMEKDVAVLKRYEDYKKINPDIWKNMLEAAPKAYNDAVNIGIFGKYPVNEESVELIKKALAWADGEAGQYVINKRIAEYGLKNTPAKVPGTAMSRFMNENHAAIIAQKRMASLPGATKPLTEDELQKDINVGQSLTGRERYYYTSNYVGDNKDVWSGVPENIKDGIYTVWAENSKEFADDVVEDPRVLNKLYKTAYMEEFFKQNPKAKLEDIYKTGWLSREDNPEFEENIKVPGKDEVYMRLIQKNAPGITQKETKRILRNIKKGEYDDAARIMRKNSGELERTDIYEVNRRPNSIIAGAYNAAASVYDFGHTMADYTIYLGNILSKLGEWGMMPQSSEIYKAVQTGNIQEAVPKDPKYFWEDHPELKGVLDFFLPAEEAHAVADRFTKTQNYDKSITEYLGNGEYKKAGELLGIQVVENLPQIAVAALVAYATGGLSSGASLAAGTASRFAGGAGAATLGAMAAGTKYMDLREQDYNFTTRISNAALIFLSEYISENFGTMFNLKRLFNIEQQALKEGLKIGVGRSLGIIGKSSVRGFFEESGAGLGENLSDIITGVRNEFGELPKPFDGIVDEGLVGLVTEGLFGTAGIVKSNVAVKLQQRQNEIIQKQKKALEKRMTDIVHLPETSKVLHYSRVDSWMAWQKIADEMFNTKSSETVHNRTTGTNSDIFAEQVDDVMSEAEDLSGEPTDVIDAEFPEEAINFVNNQAVKTLPEAQTSDDVSYIGADGEVLAKGEKSGIAEAFKDDTGGEVDMYGYEELENPAETAWMNMGNIVVNPGRSEIVMMRKPNRKQSKAMRRYMADKKEFTITVVDPYGKVLQTKDYPAGTLPAQAMRDISAYFNSGYNLQPKYKLALKPADILDESYLQEQLPALAMARGSVRAKYVNPKTGKVDHTFQRKPGWRLAGEFVDVPKELLASAPITKKGETKNLHAGLDELADEYNKQYGTNLSDYEFLDLAMEEYETFKSEEFQDNYSTWKTQQRYAERKAKLEEKAPVEERLAESKEGFLAEGTLPKIEKVEAPLTIEETAKEIYNNLEQDVVAELGIPENELEESIGLNIEYLGLENVAAAGLPQGKAAIDVMNEAARIKDAKEGVELEGNLVSGESYDEAVAAVEKAIETAEGEELGILNERLKVLKNNEQSIRMLSGEQVETQQKEEQQSAKEGDSETIDLIADEISKEGEAGYADIDIEELKQRILFAREFLGDTSTFEQAMDIGYIAQLRSWNREAGGPTIKNPMSAYLDMLYEALYIKASKDGLVDQTNYESFASGSYENTVSALLGLMEAASEEDKNTIGRRLYILKTSENEIRELLGEERTIESYQVGSEATPEIAQNDKAQDDINRASAVAAANAELAADNGIIFPTKTKLAAMLAMKRSDRQGETPAQVILNETAKQEQGIAGYETIPDNDMQVEVDFAETLEEIKNYDPKNLTPEQKGKIELFLSLEPKSGDEGIIQSDIHDKYFKKEKALSGGDLTLWEIIRTQINDKLSTAGAFVSSFAPEITDRGARMEFNNLYIVSRFQEASKNMLVNLKILKKQNKVAHDALVVALWSNNESNANEIIEKYGSKSKDPAAREAEISKLKQSIDQFRKAMDAAYEYAKPYFPNLNKMDFYFPRSVKNYKGLMEHIYNVILRNAGYSEEQIAGYKNMFQKQIEAENAKRARNKLPRLTDHEIGMIFETYINQTIFKKDPTTKGSKHTKQRMINFLTPSMLKYYHPIAETVDEYFKSMVRAVEARSFLSDIAIKNRQSYLVQKEADRIMKDYEGDPEGMQRALMAYEKKLELDALNREKVLEDIFGADTPMFLDNYSNAISSIIGELFANNQYSVYEEERIEKYLKTLFGRKRMGAFASFLANSSYIGTLAQFKSAFRQFSDVAFSMTFNGIFSTMKSVRDVAVTKYGKKFLSEVEAEAKRQTLIDVDQVMGDMNIMKNISEQSGISYSKATEISIGIAGLTAVDSFFANTLMEGYAKNMKDMLNKMTIDEKNNSIVIQIGDRIVKTIPLNLKDPETGEDVDMSDPRNFMEKLATLGVDMKIYRVENAVREMQRILGDSFLKTAESIKSGDFSSMDAKFMLYNQLRKTRPIGITDQPAFKTTADIAKVFYVLKTFPLKLVDMWRQQIFRQVKEGIQTGNVAQAANGLATAAKFIIYFSMSNAGANFLIDFIMNRPFDIEDIFLDSSLETIGFNRWQTWMFSEELKRGKSPQAALLKVIAPPVVNIGEDIWRSARRVVKGKDTLPQSGLFRYIPFFGIYEAWFGRYALKYGRNKEGAEWLQRKLTERRLERLNKSMPKSSPGSPGYK